MFRGKIFVLSLISIYVLSSAAGQNTSFSALFAFGDSVLDTGNNNFLLTLLKGNYWPYGLSFDYKFPTGRFGNGRVFTDIVGIISQCLIKCLQYSLYNQAIFSCGEVFYCSPRLTDQETCTSL